MPENKHIPIMLKEVLEAFEPTAERCFVDCTLGGGGHTEALLKHFSNARVLGCDRDLDSQNKVGERLKNFVGEKRLSFFHGNFSELHDRAKALDKDFAPPWSGLLLDLGYSSNQLEDPSYGLSFQVEGPLDMRLDRGPNNTKETAWDVLVSHSEEELGEIFRHYGEMDGSFRIARKIKEAVRSGEVTDSTRALAAFLERIQPRRDPKQIHPATLVFQALRIAVNDELRSLDTFLQHVIVNLEHQGRVAVITFHSLEDRIVKRWGQEHQDKLFSVTKKPLVPTEEEIRLNPRSRSAKLRIYEKI